MSATNVGLWLIGWGSILVIAGALGSRPDAGIGSFRSENTALQTRLSFAAGTTGLAFVAAGSLTVALGQSIEWWVIVATAVLILVSLDLLLAWPLKRAWDKKSHWATLVASTGGDMGNTKAAQRQADIARKCATWHWCMLHPLNTESWPGMSPDDHAPR